MPVYNFIATILVSDFMTYTVT